MKQILGTVLMIASAGFLIAAIWITQNWWQLLATGLIVFVIGGVIANWNEKQVKR